MFLTIPNMKGLKELFLLLNFANKPAVIANRGKVYFVTSAF